MARRLKMGDWRGFLWQGGSMWRNKYMMEKYSQFETTTWNGLNEDNVYNNRVVPIKLCDCT